METNVHTQDLIIGESVREELKGINSQKKYKGGVKSKQRVFKNKLGFELTLKHYGNS